MTLSCLAAVGLRVQLLPPHESGLSSKFFNTTPYVLCGICNESGLVFRVAAVKYGQERENNTQANPFYSPMLECSDKGALLPLQLLYDYQYVLGRLTIERCPSLKSATGLKQTTFLLCRGKH